MGALTRTRSYSASKDGADDDNFPVQYKHFGTDGELGNFSDSIFAVEDGELFETKDFEPAEVQTPEPGSLALLALGGVALLRRRRAGGA